jgi:arsenite methyltransferase
VDTGKVIGIDMTPKMVQKARANADKLNLNNVEFRLGEIEQLPVQSDTVDVVVSNCVLNLVPDKKEALSETFRILKKGRPLQCF